MGYIFTPEELENIQLKIMALLYYVKKYDKRKLPHCFGFCERIVRNIDISRAACYSGIDELTQLIIDDWKSACGAPVGLYDYYIPSDDAEIRKAMNRALSSQISDIDKCIRL